jgi:hypothetical protein
MKVKVHRWPVKVTGPRGKILERTAQPLETRELDAEWNKTKLVVFFGMGGVHSFNKNGNASRKNMRDWKIDPVPSK